jgi:hypothetical protein
MDSLGPEAHEDQRSEMASEFINPLTEEQEREQKEERENPQPTPEEMWMRQKMEEGIIEVPPPWEREKNR